MGAQAIILAMSSDVEIWEMNPYILTVSDTKLKLSFNIT